MRTNTNDSFLKEGLIDHWTLEESSGNAVGVENSTVLYSNNVSYRQDGSDLDLMGDSNDYSFGFYNSNAHLSSSTLLTTFPREFSFSCFVYPTELSGVHDIIWKRNELYEEEFLLVISDGKLGLSWQTRHGSSSTDNKIMTEDIPLNTWTHVAFAVGPRLGVTMFINGVKVYEHLNYWDRVQQFIGSGTSSAEDLLIGGRNGFQFKGRIDEIYMYEKELTTLEMRNLYELQGKSLVMNNGLQDNVLVWLDFNDLSGSYTANEGYQIADKAKNLMFGISASNLHVTKGQPGHGLLGKSLYMDYYTTQDDEGVTHYHNSWVGRRAPTLTMTDRQGNDKAFSISMWVKFDTIFSSILFQKGNIYTRGQTGYYLSMEATGSGPKLYFWIFDFDLPYVMPDAHYIALEGSSALSTGTWYHIVVTYDGSKSVSGLNMFLNNNIDWAQRLTQGTYGGMKDCTCPVVIGDTKDYPLVGYLDQLIIYDKELDSTDVSNLYNNGNGIKWGPNVPFRKAD